MHAAACSRLRIGRGKDQARQPGQDHRSRAHRARFERAVQRHLLPAANGRSPGTRRGWPAVPRGRWRRRRSRAGCAPARSSAPLRTATAPIGTSPCSAARRASSSARRIQASSSIVAGIIARPAAGSEEGVTHPSRSLKGNSPQRRRGRRDSTRNRAGGFVNPPLHARSFFRRLSSPRVERGRGVRSKLQHIPPADV